jgi:hypothetical protein
VKFVFTLVGGHISPLLVESKRRGIRVIDVRHEVTSVFAADAVARLTGRVGVAAVTAGPGVTNTITAVKNAQMAQSPLLLLGGAAATLLKGRGSLQDIDQMSLLRPICKYCATCNSVRDIVPTLRTAFKEAASGVPGPVFVELPIDVLYNVAEISANMGLLERTRAGTYLIYLLSPSLLKTHSRYVFISLGRRYRGCGQGWIPTVDARGIFLQRSSSICLESYQDKRYENTSVSRKSQETSTLDCRDVFEVDAS